MSNNSNYYRGGGNNSNYNTNNNNNRGGNYGGDGRGGGSGYNSNNRAYQGESRGYGNNNNNGVTSPTSYGGGNYNSYDRFSNNGQQNQYRGNGGGNYSDNRGGNNSNYNDYPRSGGNVNSNNNLNGGRGGGSYNNNYSNGSGGYNYNSYSRPAAAAADRRPQYPPSLPSSYPVNYSQVGNAGMGQRQVSGPNGLEKVTCSKHNKQRLRKFCVEAPVYNADGEVLRMTFACRDEDPCTTKDSFTNADSANNADGEDAGVTLFGVKITTTGNTGVAAVKIANNEEGCSDDDDDPDSKPRVRESAAKGSASLAMEGASSLGMFGVTSASPSPIASPTTLGGQSGPMFKNAPVASNRYYDLSGGNNSVDDRVENKKVCWQCGMTTHEKPNCKNTLCFTCHTHQEPGYQGKVTHRCQQVPPSDFVAMDVALVGRFMSESEVLLHNEKYAESFEDYCREVDRLKAESNDAVAHRLRAINSSLMEAVDEVLQDAAKKQLFIEPTEEERTLMTFGYQYHIPAPDDDAATKYHTRLSDGPEDPPLVSAGLLTTQCLRCHMYGHMDCPVPPGSPASPTSRSASRLTCCYCLAVGHTGLNCHSRRRDIWRERAIQASIDAKGRNNIVTSPDDAQALGLTVPTRGGAAPASTTSAYTSQQKPQQGGTSRREVFSVSDDEDDAFSGKLSKNRSNNSTTNPQSSRRRAADSWSDSSSYSSYSSSSYSDSDEYDPSKKKPRHASSNRNAGSPKVYTTTATTTRSNPPPRSNNAQPGQKRSRSGDNDRQQRDRRQDTYPSRGRGGRGGTVGRPAGRGGNFEF